MCLNFLHLESCISLIIMADGKKCLSPINLEKRVSEVFSQFSTHGNNWSGHHCRTQVKYYLFSAIWVKCIVNTVVWFLICNFNVLFISNYFRECTEARLTSSQSNVHFKRP